MAIITPESSGHPWGREETAVIKVHLTGQQTDGLLIDRPLAKADSRGGQNWRAHWLYHQHSW